MEHSIGWKSRQERKTVVSLEGAKDLLHNQSMIKNPLLALINSIIIGFPKLTCSALQLQAVTILEVYIIIEHILIYIFYKFYDSILNIKNK